MGRVIEQYVCEIRKTLFIWVISRGWGVGPIKRLHLCKDIVQRYAVFVIVDSRWLPYVDT